MNFTAVLTSGTEVPENLWFAARVRRRGSTLEVSTEQPIGIADAPSRLESLKTWLARCEAQPACLLSDADLDDLRWQGLKERWAL